MTNEEEEYITLFCEGDGSIGLNNRGYLRVDFYQKERDVLDYIDSLTKNGHIYQSKKGLWQLEFNGSYCIPLLEIFLRHVVGKKFLDRLNGISGYASMPLTVQHPLTLEGFIAFWDAEGSSSNVPRIEVTQKDREILDLIVEMFDGDISLDKQGGVYHWYLCGEQAHELYRDILKKSHCPGRAERLRQNFEGPTYYELNREKCLARIKQCDAEHKEERKAYRRKRYERLREEQRQVQEWIKAHPEEVVRLKGVDDV